MRCPFFVALLVAFPLAASLPWTSAQAQSLDGEWAVVQVCDSTQEGARGFTWRYAATVKNGRFLGQYRNPGESPSLTLEGQVAPDGSATLTARGISGSADFNQKFATSATPISFQVAAKFSAASGTGDRLGSRVCKFTFTKSR